jgi:hypothetical protein
MASEMNSVSANLRSSLIKDLKDFYRDPRVANLDGIDRLYTQDVEFHDPVHSIHGRLALKNYLKTLYTDNPDIQFTYLDDLISENSATITWQMRFSHKRLNKGRAIDLKGVTLIRFTDRIYFHEDYYDLGAMLYQHIPVIGFLIRLVNRRLSA